MTKSPAATSRDPKTAFTQDISGCLAPAIGAHGLTDDSLKNWLSKLAPHFDALKADKREKRLELLEIVEETADIQAAATAYQKLVAGAECVVFFGTGGSGLGGQTLAQLGGWDIAGITDKAQRARPRMRFYDNLDGDTLARILENFDFAKTRFIVTSKSGGTAETLAQLIATLTAVKAAGLEARIPELILGITEPEAPGKSNGLRRLLASLNVPMLDHPTGIGGRYSCFTNVGLVPAIGRGLNPFKIRQGAKSVVDALMSAKTPAEFAPAVGAALTVGMSKDRGITDLVMMPYADRLAHFSAWYVQLWAESLGKSGEGTSPIACLGPLDQHSQLQLFMDGPRAHLLTVVRVASAGVGPKIDPDYARLAGAEFFAGRHVGDVVSAQSEAVPEALKRAGRPVRTLDIEKLDENTLGAMLMHFMIETILAGRLLGLDPFDQPAVELAKILTRDRLGKST